MPTSLHCRKYLQWGHKHQNRTMEQLKKVALGRDGHSMGISYPWDTGYMFPSLFVWVHFIPTTFVVALSSTAKAQRLLAHERPSRSLLIREGFLSMPC